MKFSNFCVFCLFLMFYGMSTLMGQATCIYLNSAGSIYSFIGTIPTTGQITPWVRIDGTTKSIAMNANGEMICVGNDASVFYSAGIVNGKPNWVRSPVVNAVSVAAAGNTFIYVNSSGNIYYFLGPVPASGVIPSWTQLDGTARKIAIGTNGAMLSVGMDNYAYYSAGIVNGKANWIKISTASSTVNVAISGSKYIVINSTGKINYFSSISSTGSISMWVGVSGNSYAIAPSSDGKMLSVGTDGYLYYSKGFDGMMVSWLKTSISDTIGVAICPTITDIVNLQSSLPALSSQPFATQFSTLKSTVSNVAATAAAYPALDYTPVKTLFINAVNAMHMARPSDVTMLNNLKTWYSSTALTSSKLVPSGTTFTSKIDEINAQINQINAQAAEITRVQGILSGLTGQTFANQFSTLQSLVTSVATNYAANSSLSYTSVQTNFINAVKTMHATRPTTNVTKLNDLLTWYNSSALTTSKLVPSGTNFSQQISDVNADLLPINQTNAKNTLTSAMAAPDFITLGNYVKDANFIAQFSWLQTNAAANVTTFYNNILTLYKKILNQTTSTLVAYLTDAENFSKLVATNPTMFNASPNITTIAGVFPGNTDRAKQIVNLFSANISTRDNLMAAIKANTSAAQAWRNIRSALQ